MTNEPPKKMTVDQEIEFLRIEAQQPPAIVVTQDGVILWGFAKARALKEAGVPLTDAYVVHMNWHGATPEERKKLEHITDGLRDLLGED